MITTAAESAPIIIPGTAHASLAAAIAQALGQPLASATVVPFPDGEMSVKVADDVRGRDAVVVQPTPPPVGERLLELLLLADALRRGGAASISAVIPYFGFARQERRTHAGEALGARVVAEVLECGRFAKLFTVDLHSAALEGFVSTPVEHLSAVPLLVEAVRPEVREDCVVVSPDLGGAKLAREYATRLGVPMAVIQKSRATARDVVATEILGDVSGRRAIIVDDMISTGATILAAVEVLRRRGTRGVPTVVATHAVLAADALGQLAQAGITRLYVTDTLPASFGNGAVDRRTTSVAGLLADAIRPRLARRALPSSAPDPAQIGEWP